MIIGDANSNKTIHVFIISQKKSAGLILAILRYISNNSIEIITSKNISIVNNLRLIYLWNSFN